MGRDCPQPTPYNSSNYPTHHDCDIPVLCPEHDVATANWGENWRTPSTDDYLALYRACGGTEDMMSDPPALTAANKDTQGIYWVAAGQTVEPKYKVAGLLFVQDATHKVFFPVAGYVYDAALYDAGYGGYYWSSSLFTGNTSGAYGLYFSSDNVDPQDYADRCCGFTVRPIAD